MGRYPESVRVEALRLIAVEGCSAREVERRLGVSNVSVAIWASVAGMRLAWKTGGLERPWPPVRTGGYRLGLAERAEIGAGLAAGCSLRAIARGLGVAASTVCREVRAGRRHGVYDPGWADRQAEARRARPRPGKLAEGTWLRAVVVAELNARLSPEQIAGRLGQAFPGQGSDQQDRRVSHETIYQALYVQGRGGLRHELEVERVDKPLRSGRTSRRPRSKLPARPDRSWLDGHHLSTRPATVTDRAVPGHWEGDPVVGGAANRSSALISLIERTSRFCLLSRLDLTRDSATVVSRLISMVQTLPAAISQARRPDPTDPDQQAGLGFDLAALPGIDQLVQTLTWDQGSEMAQHARFSIASGCQVYFCDPHSPWQRGSNENLNGLVRDFFPKGTNFADVSDADVATAQCSSTPDPARSSDSAPRLRHSTNESLLR